MGRVLDKWVCLDCATTRDILLMLKDGPKTPGQIAEEYGRVTRVTISNHLLNLLEYGLVEVTPYQNQRYYRLNRNAFRSMLEEVKELMDG